MLEGGCLPEGMPVYELHEICHAGNVPGYIILVNPVALTSDDCTIKVTLSQRVRRESPILSPNSPGDVMALCHSSQDPSILTSRRRSTEDATLSKVASPITTLLARTPVSRQHFPAYAKEWQGSFLIINYYDHQTTLKVIYRT
ncbi:hypothetical protein FGIG_11162 [Fasciola gigantica]|uniref:Uncharacterized protein n=1 Tax=Fasciola gigantica TaxID=46835 RepID=A0A504Z1Y9_FASGI|nr:hypothetical protein FGIG_11162 [Fasciola gigantica]